VDKCKLGAEYNLTDTKKALGPLFEPERSEIAEGLTVFTFHQTLIGK
jgi:hypothetical protein